MTDPVSHVRTRWDRVALVVVAVGLAYAAAILLAGLLVVAGDSTAEQFGRSVQGLLGAWRLAEWCDRQGVAAVAVILRALADPSWMMAVTGSTGV